MKIYKTYRHKLGVTALLAVISLQFFGQMQSVVLSSGSFASLNFNDDFKAIDTDDPALQNYGTEEYSRNVKTEAGDSDSSYVNGVAKIQLVKSVRQGYMDCLSFARQSFPATSSFKGKPEGELIKICNDNKKLSETGNSQGSEWVAQNLSAKSNDVTTVRIELDSGTAGLFCANSECRENIFRYEVASHNVADIKAAIDSALEERAEARNRRLNCEFDEDGDSAERKERKCLEKRYRQLAKECKRERRPSRREEYVYEDGYEEKYSACDAAKDIYSRLEDKIIDLMKKDPAAAKSTLANLLKATPTCTIEQSRSDRCKLAEPYVGLLSLQLAADIRSSHKGSLEQLKNLQPGQRIQNTQLVAQMWNSGLQYDSRLKQIMALGNRTSLNSDAVLLASTGTVEPYERAACYAVYRSGATMPPGQCAALDKDMHDPYNSTSAIAKLLDVDATPTSVFADGSKTTYDSLNPTQVASVNNQRDEFFTGDTSLLKYTAFQTGALNGTPNPQALQNINNNRQRFQQM